MSQKMLLAGMMMLALSLSAHAQNYGAGSCNFPNVKQTFPTIQAAVNAVPPGSTIFVCPGVYPEQVTIMKPLTLQGRAFGNANRATITINPDLPIVPNLGGEYAQVLVTKVAPPGPVNIIGVTIDGSTGALPLDCNDVSALIAIYYDSGTTGTVNEVTSRNQRTSVYCGSGIVVRNFDPNQSITIENSSIHDFDQTGIFVTGDVTAVGNLSATLHGNFVSGSPSGSSTDIAAVAANTSITGNLATGSPVYGLLLDSNVAASVSSNTFADALIGIFNQQCSPASVPLTAQSNRISNVNQGFDLVSENPVDGCGDSFGPYLLGNLVQNTNIAVQFDYTSCPANTTLDSNQFNDSQIALNGAPASLIGNNHFANVDTIRLPGSCP